LECYFVCSLLVFHFTKNVLYSMKFDRLDTNRNEKCIQVREPADTYLKH
jgi:hypothetical protein